MHFISYSKVYLMSGECAVGSASPTTQVPATSEAPASPASCPSAAVEADATLQLQKGSAAKFFTQNPATEFFRNQLLMDHITRLVDSELDHRTALVRRAHGQFLTITDTFLTMLEHTLKRDALSRQTRQSHFDAHERRGSIAARLSTSPDRNTAGNDATHIPTAARKTYDPILSFCEADEDAMMKGYSPAASAHTPRRSAPQHHLTDHSSVRLSSNPLVSPVAVESPAVVHVDPLRVERNRGTRIRALERSLETEADRVAKFEAAEKRRTDATARRLQQHQAVALARTNVLATHTHHSHLNLQRTRQEIAARAQAHDASLAMSQRVETVEMMRKAEKEALRQMNFAANASVATAKAMYASRSARLSLHADRTHQHEASKQRHTAAHMVSNTRDRLRTHAAFEHTYTERNHREADRLERHQRHAFGGLEASKVLHPDASATTAVCVPNLPLQTLSAVQPGTFRAAAQKHVAAASPTATTSGLTSPRTIPAGSHFTPAMDPITYHRLCGGRSRGALTIAAVTDRAWGSKRLEDSDSYYFTQGPTDISWR